MSTMISADVSVEVNAAPVQAWGVVADYERDAQWRKGVLDMNPQPPGLVRVGTTTRERIRAAGRTLRNDGLVTGVDPGRGFSWQTTSGVSAEGSRRVSALGPTRCRIELSLRVAPPGLLRLAPTLTRAILQRGLAADAARLASLVEQQTVT